MTFSKLAWEATAPIRARIDDLPLLRELADGTLAPHRFVEYIAQDDFYLRGYMRALAMLATKAPTSAASGFWTRSASGAIEAEVAMHGALLADDRLASLPRATTASYTTRGYVNFLQTMTAYEPSVGKGCRPTHWVYADVGERLAATASLVKGHPYDGWVAAYNDPAFQAETRRAIELMDEAAEQANDATRDAMLTAFIDATHYEELFWARSYELEGWAP